MTTSFNISHDLRDTLKKVELSSGVRPISSSRLLGAKAVEKVLSLQGTLLNKLFDTSFKVMDVSLGRSQTTKGVWLSHNAESKLIVVDLEGTDSKERGDIGKTFEQSTALFALEIADVLIVNMWKSVMI